MLFDNTKEGRTEEPSDSRSSCLSLNAGITSVCSVVSFYLVFDMWKTQHAQLQFCFLNTHIIYLIKGLEAYHGF
jgi:Tfp pilus assembly protein PilN